MKKRIVLGVLGLCLLSLGARSQGIRRPVWSGQFYDSDKATLSRRLTNISAAGDRRPGSGPDPGNHRSPRRLCLFGENGGRRLPSGQGERHRTVVIVGPSHRVGFEGCSIYPRGGFETPLGVAEVDGNHAQALIQASGFTFIPEAHAEEHSLEVQVPFIQKDAPAGQNRSGRHGHPFGRDRQNPRRGFGQSP